MTVDPGGRQADTHPGVLDTDLTALSEGGRPRAQDGVQPTRTSLPTPIEATEFMDL